MVLQEILRKMEIFDSRLGAIESNTQGRAGREEEAEDEGEALNKNVVNGVNWSGERVTRQTKVEFPSFDGNRVQEWLFKCERFFELNDTPTKLRVSIALVYLSGLAMEWHYAFVKNRKLLGPISWVEYAEAMTIRFDSVDVIRPMAQLKRLMEEESLFTYIDSFVALVSQVELSDEDQVAMFIEGLKGDNVKLRTVLKPNNLQQAIAFAKTLTREEDPYERRGRARDQPLNTVKPLTWSNNKYMNGGNNAKAWQGTNRLVIAGKSPMDVIGKGAVYKPLHKRFTSAEIDEKRAKGLCFWCDEKFTFGHKRANRKLYSMVLEQMEEEDEAVEPVQSETKEEGATVSLHALNGVGLTGKNQTMKLIGHFKKRRLNILIDSGNTHNFLDQNVAKQVGCEGQRITTQKVMVANGDKMVCNAMIRKFNRKMQGKVFENKV